MERERERERGDSHKTCHVSSRTYDLFITKQNFLYLEITITLRLCLVPVKYFPEMLFSGKENIFKCVAL